MHSAAAKGFTFESLKNPGLLRDLNYQEQVENDSEYSGSESESESGSEDSESESESESGSGSEYSDSESGSDYSDSGSDYSESESESESSEDEAPRRRGRGSRNRSSQKMSGYIRREVELSQRMPEKRPMAQGIRVRWRPSQDKTWTQVGGETGERSGRPRFDARDMFRAMAAALRKN